MSRINKGQPWRPQSCGCLQYTVCSEQAGVMSVFLRLNIPIHARLQLEESKTLGGSLRAISCGAHYWTPMPYPPSLLPCTNRHLAKQAAIRHGLGYPGRLKYSTAYQTQVQVGGTVRTQHGGKRSERSPSFPFSSAIPTRSVDCHPSSTSRVLFFLLLITYYTLHTVPGLWDLRQPQVLVLVLVLPASRTRLHPSAVHFSLLALDARPIPCFPAATLLPTHPSFLDQPSNYIKTRRFADLLVVFVDIVAAALHVLHPA